MELTRFRGHLDLPNRVNSTIPIVENQNLQQRLGALFHGIDNVPRYGDGSAIDAAIHEQRTGEFIEGVDHAASIQQVRRSLANWLRDNESASATDRATAQEYIDRIDASVEC